MRSRIVLDFVLEAIGLEVNNMMTRLIDIVGLKPITMLLVTRNTEV